MNRDANKKGKYEVGQCRLNHFSENSLELQHVLKARANRTNIFLRHYGRKYYASLTSSLLKLQTELGNSKISAHAP